MPLFPLPRNSAGGRLHALTGLSLGQYLKAFDRTNLVHKFPGRTGTDDRFPLAQARAAAMALLPLLAGRRVVLLGRGVAKAFGIDHIELLTWHGVHAGHGAAYGTGRVALFAVLPHTSGRSRWYNEPDNVARARQFLTDLIAEGTCSSSATGA